MRVLVCGSRTWNDYNRVLQELTAIHRQTPLDVVIEGGATGADKCAVMSAIALGVPVETFLPDWFTHGKHAGPIRNKAMLVKGRPDLVLAFWDGKSRGTRDMIYRSRHAGVEVRVIMEEK